MPDAISYNRSKLHIGRYAVQCNSGFSVLPQHLWDIIIEKSEDTEGKKALASMRLVSKALHAAVTAYPGKLRIYCVSQYGEIAEAAQDSAKHSRAYAPAGQPRWSSPIAASVCPFQVE